MPQPPKPRLAWIGAGIMGLPMAGHLLAAGYPLAVHTRTPARAQPLLERGAKRASSGAEAAENADVVFICVTDTPDVEAVLFGEGGIEQATTRRPGLVIVDHSTISPSATRDFAARLAKHGAFLIDAPVSGGDAGARAGTLAIMCGGDARFFCAAASSERSEEKRWAGSSAKPAPAAQSGPGHSFSSPRGLGSGEAVPLPHIMAAYGKTITHCGGSGSGQLTKLLNQILVAVTNLAVAEAVVFAEAAGLDPQTTLAAVGGGAAASWQLANQGPKMFASDYAPGFMIDLQQKDLRLVLEYAREKGLSLPATSLVHQLLSQAQAKGRGREGTQALVTVLREMRAW